jgi:hypothetical protein
MEQFALIATHPPDQCPTANETIRKVMLNRQPDMEKLGKKHGVKYLAGPLVTTQHTSYSIVQAENVEAVRAFLLESGLIQWNSIDLVHGVTMDRALEEINKLKPIY